MKILTTLQASSKLGKLLEQTAEEHEPIQIMGKKANGILISQEDWSAIQETLYLLSIPGMRSSIRKGLSTPIEKCLKELKW